jgi:hypothetical protein
LTSVRAANATQRHSPSTPTLAQEIAMSLHGPIRCKNALCATTTEDYLRHTGFSLALRALLIFVAVVVLSGLLLVAWDGRPALSQAVILVTGNVNREALKDFGEARILQKPYAEAELKETIASALTKDDLRQ